MAKIDPTTNQSPTTNNHKNDRNHNHNHNHRSNNNNNKKKQANIVGPLAGCRA